MSADPEATNKIAVEDLAPAKPVAADTDAADPLRRAALIVVAVTIILFALSVVMERLTPSSAQAVVQAYVVRMAPEVAGRVIGVDVLDNARVDAEQVLFRIDPRPFEPGGGGAESRGRADRPDARSLHGRRTRHRRGSLRRPLNS